MELNPNRKKYNRFWFGLTLGLLVPFLFLVIYWLWSYKMMSLVRFIQFLLSGKVLAPVISLCVTPNLGLFFLSLNREYYKTARGVIFSTILYGLLIVFLKAFVEDTL